MSSNYKTSYNDTDHYVMPFDSFNSGVVKSKVCIEIFIFFLKNETLF